MGLHFHHDAHGLSSSIQELLGCIRGQPHFRSAREIPRTKSLAKSYDKGVQQYRPHSIGHYFVLSRPLMWDFSCCTYTTYVQETTRLYSPRFWPFEPSWWRAAVPPSTSPSRHSSTPAMAAGQAARAGLVEEMGITTGTVTETMTTTTRIIRMGTDDTPASKYTDFSSLFCVRVDRTACSDDA